MALEISQATYEMTGARPSLDFAGLDQEDRRSKGLSCFGLRLSIFATIASRLLSSDSTLSASHFNCCRRCYQPSGCYRFEERGGVMTIIIGLPRGMMTSSHPSSPPTHFQVSSTFASSSLPVVVAPPLHHNSFFNNDDDDDLNFSSFDDDWSRSSNSTIDHTQASCADNSKSRPPSKESHTVCF